MALTPEQETSIWKVLIVAAALLVAFLGYEFFEHETGIFAGVSLCINSLEHGFIAFWGVVAGTVGAAAASITLLSCIVIPVTTVSIYTIFRKAEDQPKAYVVAIGLFLNPLFIDFFKDKIHEEHQIQRLLLLAVGAVTFLIAISLWNQATNIQKRGSSGKARFAQAIAIFLFLLPTLCMLGYVAISAHKDSKAFMNDLSVPNVVGLIGLIVTSVLGISFSRIYDAP